MRFTIKPEDADPIIIKDSQYGYSIGWHLMQEGVDGWFNTPTLREDFEEHPTMDGSIKPLLMTQRERIVTLTAGYQFNSSVAAADAMDAINNLFGKELTITCEDASGSRSAIGYLSDSPDITLMNSEDTFIVELIITCPDPHKYSQAITYRASNNRITVLNLGNCDTWPVLRASGSVTSLTATLNGHTISWSGSTSNLVIDFRRGTCSSGTMSVDDAFPIPPGEHVVSITTNSGVSVSMEVKSAWR